MFDYSAPENHILRREGLPANIRETLLESTRDQWSAHPRYGGKAGFFMNIHRDLLNGSAYLSSGLERLLDVPEGELANSGGVSAVADFGRRLIGFAHHHHEIEDQGYFPHFTLLYPQMDRAMKLLDGDHRALEEALHDTEGALQDISNVSVTRDRLANLYRNGKALDDILKRHIWDEEEIIIPIFLKHA